MQAVGPQEQSNSQAAAVERNPMKVRASLRSLKNQPGAQVVKREGKIYVINKQNPRMKGRQK
ncbi:50S ribosomal protein L36 2 [Brevibacterium ravenspurgense]|uniref:Large ribosomal subunit protein bL36 n=1 Tax=Brevibacterium ravenspurgense TaxID=479117 RepID=A0A150HC22_9MICO|nr:50S ribosomal protein L36 2 [Brevibacterium ravenspurgense]